jgi:hypothetical protein
VTSGASDQARKGFSSRHPALETQLERTTDFRASVASMSNRVNLFNALVAAAAFRSAALLPVRTGAERLLLCCRETWKDEADYTFELVALGLTPVALIVALLLLQ